MLSSEMGRFRPRLAEDPQCNKGGNQAEGADVKSLRFVFGKWWAF